MAKLKISNSNDLKPCTHLAGEYYVAAELSRMGLNVAMTMGNAKRVDLIIEHKNKTLPIQVKALAKKQNVGWPLNLKTKFNKDLVFVFVVLGSVGDLPEYYILDGGEVEKHRLRYKSRGILNIYSVVSWRDRWDVIYSRLGIKT